MSPPRSWEDVRPWLTAVLTRLAPAFNGDISDDTPLAEGGLCLDSLGLVDLIQEIQAGLAVTIEEKDISPERLGTVGLLLDLLALRSSSRVKAPR